MTKIEVGSVYKVDHAKLPSQSSLPLSLSSTKAVLVDQVTDIDITVKFPSESTIKKFFNEDKKAGVLQPCFDESFKMGLNLGKKILSQKIPFEEFAAKRGDQSFWAVDFNDGNDDDDHRSSNGLRIKWGLRKRPTYTGNNQQRDVKKVRMLPCGSVKKNGDGDKKKKKGDVVKVDVKMEERESNGDEEQVVGEKKRVLKKRKCQFKGVKYTEKKKKKKKVVKSTDVVVGTNVIEKKCTMSKHRWTVERYKQAEKHMMEIMKAKGAVPGNPILRPDLRTEARKSIGDTGLLDHLLKHMAGKLAPGGKERFRRRHNPEGAMEYWLESADLIEIRKKAGIEDTFWTPPPGWKPGDSPTLPPSCAQELKELTEEVANMKREIGNLACRENENSQAIVAAPTGPVSFDFQGSLKPLKTMYEELMKKRAQVEQQLSDISKSLHGMEEDIGLLKRQGLSPNLMAQVGEKVRQGLAKGTEEQDKEISAETTLLKGEEKLMILAETVLSKGEEKLMITQKQVTKPEDEAAATAAAEVLERLRERDREREERRKRMKSGFRICKPQGTFLWPSQIGTASASSNSQMMFHLEDLLRYPTPPSVSSSSCRAPPLIFPPPQFNYAQPPSPLIKRPVAQRASVTLTYSTTTIRGATTIDNISSPTTTGCGSSNFGAFVPDLNEVPLTSFT